MKVSKKYWIWAAAAAIVVIAVVTLGAADRKRISHEVYNGLSGRPVSEIAAEGNKFIRTGEVDSALVRFTALEMMLSRKLNRSDTRDAAMALSLGASYLGSRYGNYPRAFQYALTADEVAREQGLNDVRTISSSVMSNISNVYGDHESTLEYGKESFRAACRAREWDAALESFANLLITNLNGGEISEIRQEIAEYKALPLPDSPHRHFTDAFMQGVIDFKKGNYAGANQAFDRAVPYIDTTWNSARSPGILLLLKSRAAMLQGRYREAAALTHQYASLPEISGDPDVQFEAARALTQAYKAMGMTDSAYHYMARSVEMADSLLAPSSYGSLRDMQADRDLSRAAEQYRLLELQGRWVRIALWFSLGVVAVVSLLLWLIVRQKRQLKVRNRELFDRYQEALEQERRGAERLDELTRLMERKPAADSIAAEAAEAEMPTGECGQEQLLIADRVRKTLDTSERIYEKDFTMDTLAEMMEVPKRFISQAINAVFHKNFPTLLGEARVREACRRLGDPENFGHLTIEGIADSIGFRSRTNFVSVFKKVTGLTPSEYQSVADSKKNNGEN